MKRLALAAKRLADLVIAASLLLVLSPVILAAAIGSAVAMGRPVLFRQQRPGYKGRPFVLVKFRTMREAYDAAGNPLPDKDRLTRIGQLLRKTSVDELPQLLNVIRGEMSLVGPRPLLMRYLDRYTPEQMRRHDVRPGISGLAQVRGRNAIGWDAKFAQDVWYVDHWSLWLDVQIVIWTMLAIARRSGISQAGEATVGEFMGSQAADGK
jgi:sugar transferase EpsL